MNKDEYRFTLKKMWIHLSTIVKHRHYVFLYCCRCGIPFQGLVHDLSKFSPEEFLTNVKYTVNGRSPIEVQKEVEGYSPSWMHHKSHNKHHHVFWMDRFDEGCYVTRMPEKYIVECLCDFLGAGKAYNKDGFTYKKEYEWWLNRRKTEAMHPDNIKFIDVTLAYLRGSETEGGVGLRIKDTDILNKNYLKNLYDNIVENSKNPLQVKITEIERN